MIQEIAITPSTPVSTQKFRRMLCGSMKNALAWNNIAAGYESLHQWDEAIAAARKAIALKPDFQLARNNLAWSLQQKSSTGGKP